MNINRLFHLFGMLWVNFIDRNWNMRMSKTIATSLNVVESFKKQKQIIAVDGLMLKEKVVKMQT